MSTGAMCKMLFTDEVYSDCYYARMGVVVEASNAGKLRQKIIDATTNVASIRDAYRIDMSPKDKKNRGQELSIVTSLYQKGNWKNEKKKEAILKIEEELEKLLQLWDGREGIYKMIGAVVDYNGMQPKEHVPVLGERWSDNKAEVILWEGMMTSYIEQVGEQDYGLVICDNIVGLDERKRVISDINSSLYSSMINPNYMEQKAWITTPVFVPSAREPILQYVDQMASLYIRHMFPYKAEEELGLAERLSDKLQKNNALVIYSARKNCFGP